MIWNEDCIKGARNHLDDNSIDLLICDPPFGIEDSTLDKHYYRDSDRVVEGYVEAPKEFDQYREFTLGWIQEASRVLSKNGTLYVISGWNNLESILWASRISGLDIMGHIIWKYNFGVYTTKKWVTSHYHVIPFCKQGRQKHTTFNTYCRYGSRERGTVYDRDGTARTDRNLAYLDREDVFLINKENVPQEDKNQNKLPDELIRKLIMYSSNPNDLVCDFFLGSFVTAIQSKRLGRNSCGFELNENSFNTFYPKWEKTEFGCDLKTMKVIEEDSPVNQGKPVDDLLALNIQNRYAELKTQGLTKKAAKTILSQEYGRGEWSLERILKREILGESDSNTCAVLLDEVSGEGASTDSRQADDSMGVGSV